jgi:transcriptional regulator with XRE-family HTH domain
MNNKDDIRFVYDLVSHRIKLFRKFRGLTQEELAEKTTFYRGLIGNIESAKTSQTFSLAVLYAFAKDLDIPLELFVKDDIKDELKELGCDEKEIFSKKRIKKSKKEKNKKSKSLKKK